ncbi:hypothetical protein BJ322DRAFT_139251 [Thelephora terrestris]|uniref:Uncharacterized protein n=1 Tax=Thelephora terrestris TaxID=56493 RepID=A0A9P6HAW1_9AGAM|nr:hypothetical protein BJ322DRAFT_139251 [Thelephora terrestris]
MPVPAAPRRVAPPRRKKETPKVSDELPAPSQEGENVPEAKIPLPESTSNLLADAEGEKIEGPLNVKPEPVSTAESSLPIKGDSPELAKDSSLVTERSTSPTLVKPGDHDDVPEDARAPSTPKEDQPAPLLSEDQLAELVEEGQKEIEERSGVDQPEQDLEEPLAEISKDEEPAGPDTTADREDEAEVLPAEPGVTEDKLEEQPEGEEDEVTRRARIAVRLANSGGFNPFAGGPPVRKPSESSIPERRTSVETPGQFKPTLHEEQEPPVRPLARRDADSLDDTTGSPTTEAKEEDKLFDTLKRVEDNDGNLDENEEFDDEGVHSDDVDAELEEVPPPPPFAVHPPPSLISQSAPRNQRAPGSRIPTESSDHPDEKPGPPPPLPPGRPSAAPPPPPAPTRPIPSRQKAESQESHEVASRNSEEYEEERSATSFDFPRYTDTISIVQRDVSQQDPPEPEILADEDGGRVFPSPQSLECRINP